MRRYFQEYGLTILAAITSAYVFDVFSRIAYGGNNNQMWQIIKDWIGRLT